MATTKLIFKKRLLKLVDHLRNGKLGHKYFNFSYLNNTPDLCGLQTNENRCGTNGCALGECPFVFKEWIFGDKSIGFAPKLTTIVYIKADMYSMSLEYALKSAEKFFGIHIEEARYLFVPDNDNGMTNDATRYEVADHIEKFVKEKYGSL